MMKTAHTGWTLTARRHTLYLFAIFTLLGTFLFSSCRDEELVPTPYAQGANAGVSHADGTTTSGLIQNEDGTWTATRRVPLVGVGRMLNNISNALIEVGTWADDAKKVVDLDLENGFDTGTSGVGVDLLANQIISVYDASHVYAAGQKVGFVIESNSGVLELDALSDFWLKTFLDGKEQDHITFSESMNVADLGLGNITGGTSNSLQVVEGTTTKAFDEVRIGYGGVASVSIANTLTIYYAYVGENPIIPAVNKSKASPISSEYFNDEVGYVTGVNWSSYAGRPSLVKLIDDDLDNGIGIETLSSLFQPYMTVDFGREVPAGSEVGFYITNGDLLNLSIRGTTEITTYYGEEEADNYTLTRIVGLQALGGGSSYLCIKTEKPCTRVKIQFWGVTVKLGVTSVHYAFVREKTEVDVSSYFNLSDAVAYTPHYRFALPQGLPDGATIKYDVTGPSDVKIEQGEDGAYVLKGMNVAGDYTVTATLTVGGKTTTCQSTITRLVKNSEDCSVALINGGENDHTYTATIDEGFSGVEVGGNITNGDINNVVNATKSDYLEYTSVGVDLFTDKSLIKVSGPQGQAINGSIKNMTRVGFVIGRDAQFLKLDLLKFLRIKLYYNGEEVESKVGDDNNGISLGLIQLENAGKQACVSIETTEQFDAVELFWTGLASVDLGGTLRIYYAYYEDAEATCQNPGEECIQLITNANYNALATSNLKSGLQLGTGTGNLSDIVDNDVTTASTIVNTANVGSFTLEATFDPITIRGAQEAGFILSTPEGLLDLSVIEASTITAYLGDEKKATFTGSVGILGLKVAGIGGRQYISINALETGELQFDRLELSLGGLELVKTFLIHGVYFLPDYDGDGFVDCIMDEASTELTDLEITPKDICEGDSVEIRPVGGIVGGSYTLRFKNLTNGSDLSETTARIDETGALILDETDLISNLTPGSYQIEFFSNAKTVWNDNFEVHPKKTTWTGNDDSDWTNWNNWTEGEPWGCTDVIIPSPSGSSFNQNRLVNYYPVLKASDNAQCNNIHFEPGAELVNQHLLTYSQALVDMTLESGRYQLVSAPLQSMATGDMYISSRSDWNTWRPENYFTALDNENYPVNRFDPKVYQRFWSEVVSNATASRAYSTDDPALTAEVLTTDWSRSFNAVSAIYGRGQGFAIRVGEIGESGPYQFSFPKMQQEYAYYDQNTEAEVGTRESVRRSNSGKLMIDLQFPSTILLNRENAGTIFLFGNPFMAHISIKQLLDANSGIAAVYVYRGNEDGTGEYITIDNGISTRAYAPAEIAPMEAVFIKVNDEEAADYFELNLNPDMLCQKGQADTYNTFIPQLRMTASRNGSSASCVVLHSGEASDGYDSREDAALLVGKEEGTDVAVYTTAGRKALSIQRVNGAARIPVGFYMKRTGDVDLKFEAGDDS